MVCSNRNRSQSVGVRWIIVSIIDFARPIGFGDWISQKIAVSTKYNAEIRTLSHECLSHIFLSRKAIKC